MARFIHEIKRTHRCGSLRAENIGEEVVLMGWVHNRRDHGGCVFIDLRDRDGLTQIVFDPQIAEEAHRVSGDLRTEWVLGLTGRVRGRGSNINPKLATGKLKLLPRDWRSSRHHPHPRSRLRTILIPQKKFD